MVQFILSRAKLCELGSMLSYFLHLTNHLNCILLFPPVRWWRNLTLISVFIWELSFFLLFVKMMYRSKLILNRKFSYLKNLHLFSYIYWFKLHLPVCLRCFWVVLFFCVWPQWIRWRLFNLEPYGQLLVLVWFESILSVTN